MKKNGINTTCDKIFDDNRRILFGSDSTEEKVSKVLCTYLSNYAMLSRAEELSEECVRQIAPDYTNMDELEQLRGDLEKKLFEEGLIEKRPGGLHQRFY